MAATLKAQEQARKKSAIYIAKGMKSISGQDWHERASSACYAPKNEKLHVFPTEHQIQIEWYIKITPMGSKLVNISVCYRLTQSMSGYYHIDRFVDEAQTCVYFDNTVFIMQREVRETVLAGAKAMLHLLKTNDG